MDLTKAVDDLRAYYLSGATRPYEFRMDALTKLYDVIEKNEDAISEAMHADLGKVAYESYMTEVGLVLEQIRHTKRHLKEWMAPKHVSGGISAFPSSCKVLKEPYGVALIMAPWNYPFMLTMEPLVGAIAAGNTVLVQPSDYSANTTKCIADLLSKIYPPNYVLTILGGHHENPTLLDHHFDYIFFTGSTRIGKVVLQAAANFVTPVTLELGGMSPCIVDETANLDVAGKRIMWGKVLNSGQTCVAPDYVYVHSSKKDELLDALEKALTDAFPNGALEDPTYPHMINEKAYNRVVGLMQDVTIACGGHVKPETLQIEPTILTDVTWDSPVMSEEIFGPLLPILTYDNLDDIIQLINTKPRPLACYAFTKNDETVHKIETELTYGGGCINDTVVHVAVGDLPFGGVGASGMGHYHGKYSFDTFTHEKGVVDRSTAVDMKFRYHPYEEKNLKLVKRLIH